jgi:hypothetical protein
LLVKDDGAAGGGTAGVVGFGAAGSFGFIIPVGLYLTLIIRLFLAPHYLTFTEIPYNLCA